MWIGTFAVIMMIYLFLAPKLVKKGSSKPPRAGSNKERAVIQQVASGGMGGSTAGGFPYMEPSGAGGGSGFGIVPEGGRGPEQEGMSFGGSDVGGFKLGQAYRARRRAHRARRAYSGRSTGSGMFPFANLVIS
jgi:hypothetical protein